MWEKQLNAGGGDITDSGQTEVKINISLRFSEGSESLVSVVRPQAIALMRLDH